MQYFFPESKIALPLVLRQGKEETNIKTVFNYYVGLA
jgi:hypothetical protein